MLMMLQIRYIDKIHYIAETINYVEHDKSNQMIMSQATTLFIFCLIMIIPALLMYRNTSVYHNKITNIEQIFELLSFETLSENKLFKYYYKKRCYDVVYK